MNGVDSIWLSKLFFLSRHHCRREYTAQLHHFCTFIITFAKEEMLLPVFVCLFVCLSVCQQHNSKSYGRIFLKFWGYVGHSINYQWFNFGGDPAGILDSGSLWNFPYHCVKGGIREPLAKWIWWRHLANNIALAEVPAGYDCFLVSPNINRFSKIFYCRNQATICNRTIAIDLTTPQVCHYTILWNVRPSTQDNDATDQR